MFNKISLIFLFLILHLSITIGLKSSNYCMLKQKKCIGLYDSKQNYQIKSCAMPNPMKPRKQYSQSASSREHACTNRESMWQQC